MMVEQSYCEYYMDAEKRIILGSVESQETLQEGMSAVNSF
jgi:hypothetical protein